ncbi:MAG TPA: DNA translocase FtsK, partial [Bacillota bacterium]|nr:DNA translocase FtsK [Bacillota bacterium]
SGMDGIGTGAIPAIYVYPTYFLFGLAGSYIFFISMIFISLLLLTNLSLKEIGNDIYNHIRLKKTEKQKVKGKSKQISKKADNKSKKKLYVDDIKADQTGKANSDIMPLEDSFTSSIDSQSQDIKIIDFDKEGHRSDNGSNIKTGPKTPQEDLDLTTGDIANGDGETISIQTNHSRQEALPYMIPPITLLKEPAHKSSSSKQEKNVLKNARLLEETLNSFGVATKVTQVSRGPVITRYELQPAPGVKVSRIVNLSDDIALNLAAPGVRIEAPIPGKAAIGIEIPNQDTAPVYLREVLESNSFDKEKSKISFGLGKDITGKNIIADISKMPHMLIAGATGSGKSVCLNSIIISILYKATPDEVKLIMIDPKVVELSVYNGIPHLLIPVVTDPKKAAGALNWAVQEMTSRYKKFADKGVRDFDRYNERLDVDEAPIPQLVVIIDELSDLMMVAPNDVEDAICRLAQMARAAGIHLIIATQRPSVDVITGVIKANITSRIAFAVSSQIDSRTILDMGGAEKLLGRGDMLFSPVGTNKPFRVQGAYISEKEVEAVVKCIKNQNEGPEYNMDVLEETAADSDGRLNEEYDERLPDAIETVIDAGQASISMLQRRLRVGYARAARLIDEMENRGLVSGFDGSKPRNVLITREEFEHLFKEL